MKQLGSPGGHQGWGASQPDMGQRKPPCWKFKVLYQLNLTAALSTPRLSVVVQGLQWARSSGASSRKQPSLPWSSRDSLVFIIYLDVRILMGYSELIWRTPTCVKSFSVLCHPKTSPNKSSYRCSHFVGCLALESARGPGLWSSWGPTSPWRLFKASGGGSGFRHSE